jgi:hypothetical protein
LADTLYPLSLANWIGDEINKPLSLNASSFLYFYNGMKELTLISTLLFSFFINYSQQVILLFKKKNTTLQSFWVGSTIAFQLKDKQWQKGEITRINSDSFFIRPVVVQYNLLTADTFYYHIAAFSVSDIYAMPKKGVLIDYKKGEFEISRSGGHLHWYWIKSGWIFRVAGASYAGLIVANSLIDSDLSVSDSKTQLGIAAGVFLVGVLLKKAYKLTWRLGKKYHVETFQLRQ